MPQAILLQDVEKLGERGEVIDVSKGYLRNYLIPRKLAEPATKGSVEAAARRKPCLFCKDKIEHVDYKDVGTLRRFISERGKIRSRRITGACRRHQNQIATAVKRARELALLPYVSDTPERERGGRGDRDRDRER